MWMDGLTDGGIDGLDEWMGCRSYYRRIPQDTACYPWMLQDTFIDRNLTLSNMVN